MKAVIFDAPGKIRIGEIDTPQLKPEEALIAIKASGLCGTDLHIYDGDFIASYPVVPGHEFAGEVVDVGPDVVDVHVGDKVAIDPSIYCNRCKFCRENKQNFCNNYRGYGIHYNGGFAEFAAIHQRNLYPIEGLSYLEVRDKGRILFFGVCSTDAKISISPYDVYKRELKICGAFALLHTARQVVDVIKSKKVDVQSLVSHQFPLEDFEKAFALKQQGKDAMKIMIIPV